MEGKVDLDRYDHVTCIISFNMRMGYKGKHAASYQNGSSHATLNYVNQTLPHFGETDPWPIDTHVHEFLHFMERMNQKFGTVLDIHLIREQLYSPATDSWQRCYTDIILNQVKGDSKIGTGVVPVAWQYPPHVLRTMTEWTVPSGVTSIGNSSFRECVGLTSVTFSSGNASIGDRAFWGLKKLTRVTIPTSVTNIGYAAFWDTGVKDVYYAGTEAQWKAIQMGEYNGALTKAAIHYNHLMADVKTSDWFAQPVMWALEKGIAAGTGGGGFSPNATCTQGQILTFLWRAYGSPETSGKVSGSEYYAVPLQWAREQGVTAGTSAATFAPNSTCTRGQIVTFLRQALAK